MQQLQQLRGPCACGRGVDGVHADALLLQIVAYNQGIAESGLKEVGYCTSPQDVVPNHPVRNENLQGS